MKTIKSTLVAVTMGILSFAAVSISANESEEKNVIVQIHKLNNNSTTVDLNVDGAAEVFELPELQVGESKEIVTESGKVISLSRTETGMSVSIDGDEIDLPHVYGDMQALISKDGIPLHTNISKGIQVIGDLTDEQIAIIKDGFAAAGVDKEINFTKGHEMKFITIESDDGNHFNMKLKGDANDHVWFSKNDSDVIIESKVLIIEKIEEEN